MKTSEVNLKRNTQALLNRVRPDKPLHIKRKRRGNLVILPASEYRGIMETFYLLRTPESALSLLEAIEEHKQWKATMAKAAG